MSNRPICGSDTPDPWIITARGRFYLTFTLDNRIEIWESPLLENFFDCNKSVVWDPPPGAPWSENIWAPELHYLDNAWYIYTCGAPPGIGNPGHRTVLLKSCNPDPMDPTGWLFLGPIPGMPDLWSIDATVFSPDGHDLYCCWSGWPFGDHSDTEQDLFIIKMASPQEAIRDSVVCISVADQAWERPENGRRGINEGPTWVDFAGFRGIVYSAHGSWTSDYKLGLLAMVGYDPLRPESWVKRPAPLLISDGKRGGPFGPGHASFLPSPHSPARIFCIYHATEKSGEGWKNRKARVVSLSAESFAPSAPPVCCGELGLAHNSPSRYQQAPPQAASPQAAAGPQGEATSTRQKVGGSIVKLVDKAPPQVKHQLHNIMGKAKKYM